MGKKNEYSTFFSTFNSCNNFVRNFAIFPQLIGPGMPAVNMALAGEFTLYLLIALAFLKVFATAFVALLVFMVAFSYRHVFWSYAGQCI